MDGGLVESGAATIGGPFGGEATVSGHDSKWKTGNLAVGHGGNGNLNIVAGGEVESGLTNVVGFTAGSVGEVTVTGIDATDGSSSSWTIDNVLTVGGAGATGGLNILDGGVVFAFALGVAGDAGSTGRVIVSGRNAGGIGFGVAPRCPGHQGGRKWRPGPDVCDRRRGRLQPICL